MYKQMKGETFSFSTLYRARYDICNIKCTLFFGFPCLILGVFSSEGINCFESCLQEVLTDRLIGSNTLIPLKVPEVLQIH